MKYAIFGDIHANLEALEAVLADAAARGVSHYACTGDVVGVWANPHECVQRLRELNCPVVQGEFDQDAADTGDTTGLNPRARMFLEWTRRQLNAEDRSWLGGLPLVHQGQDFTIVHATLDDPATRAFVLNPFDAAGSFNWQFTQACFFGHTHTPRFYVKGRNVTVENTETLRIEPGRKYFINAGSVGLPRDGDWRAAYAVYDHSNQEVSIRRVPYDRESARRKLHVAGLDIWRTDGNL